MNFKTFYVSAIPEHGDLCKVESAVRAEGHSVELAEVLCAVPAINVHGYTYRSESSIRYWLRVAGAEILEVA